MALVSFLPTHTCIQLQILQQIAPIAVDLFKIKSELDLQDLRLLVFPFL